MVRQPESVLQTHPEPGIRLDRDAKRDPDGNPLAGLSGHVAAESQVHDADAQ
jgi:hypothetical protein